MLPHRAYWLDNLPLVKACHDHPFLIELRSGRLPEAVFRGYMAQDAFFLRAFMRAYALALAKAGDAPAQDAFAELIQGMSEELRLHASYAGRLGVDLEAARPNRAARAYTDFLLATAWRGTLGEILAAMTPCMRLYADLGAESARRAGAEGTSEPNPYQSWIDRYASEDFEQLARKLEALLDRYTDGLEAGGRAYHYAMQRELDFFDEAYRGGEAAAGGVR